MCPRGRPRGQGRPRGLHLWLLVTQYRYTSLELLFEFFCLKSVLSFDHQKLAGYPESR